MAAPKSPRKGSLQFWPRKRAQRFLPSANWDAIDSGKNLKGFIGYKAGMVSVSVRDKTEHSMTKDKIIAIPATVIECPAMKIFSVRFYKNGKVMSEVLVQGLEKELKRVVKMPKKQGKKIEDVKDYDDVRVIAYSLVKRTGLKKKPDMIEIGIKGSLDEKVAFVKDYLNKELTIADVFESGQLVDTRGLTKGKGFSGPVKRFGITLRSHKAEKGVRKVGSIGPWHPARVTFRVPMAGQLGMFSRVVYNNKIIGMGKAEGKIKNLKNFGDVKTDYILVEGSVQGPAKRQIIISAPLRPTRSTAKKNYEFLEIIR